MDKTEYDLVNYLKISNGRRSCPGNYFFQKQKQINGKHTQAIWKNNLPIGKYL